MRSDSPWATIRRIVVTFAAAVIVGGSGLVAAEFVRGPAAPPDADLSSLALHQRPDDAVPPEMFELFTAASHGDPIPGSFRHQGRADGFDTYLGRGTGGDVCIVLTTGSEYTAGCGDPVGTGRRATWVRLGTERGDAGVAVVIPDRFAIAARAFAPGQVFRNSLMLTGEQARKGLRKQLTDADGEILTIDIPDAAVDDIAPVPPTE